MTRVRIALVAVLALVALTTPPASAHTANYMPVRWKGNMNVPFRFATNVPGGAFRTQIIKGFLVWDDHGRTLNWTLQSPDYASFAVSTTCAHPARKNAVQYKEIPNDPDESFAAVTYKCYDPADLSQLWTANMVVDSTGHTWWLQDGLVPSNQIDLHSAASHEVGHMAGFGTSSDPALSHFNENDNTICGERDTATYDFRETMCPLIYAGTRIQRTPYTHDFHEFDAAYPAR